MRNAPIAVLAATALAVALSGCGGGADTPDALVTCVEDAGLNAETVSGDEAVGITGAARWTCRPRIG